MENLDSEEFLFDADGEITLIKTICHYENHMKSIYGENESCWPCMSGYNNSLFYILDQTRISNPYSLLSNAIAGIYPNGESDSIIKEFTSYADKFPRKGSSDYSPFEIID